MRKNEQLTKTTKDTFTHRKGKEMQNAKEERHDEIRRNEGGRKQLTTWPLSY